MLLTTLNLKVWKITRYDNGGFCLIFIHTRFFIFVYLINTPNYISRTKQIPSLDLIRRRRFTIILIRSQILNFLVSVSDYDFNVVGIISMIVIVVIT